jgi:hypothetical protein
VRAYVDIGVVVVVLVIANVIAHFTTAWANIATVPIVAIGLVLLVRARGLSWTELGLGHEHWNHLAVQVRPGGLAVHQEHGRCVARAFVDVGHAQWRAASGVGDLNVVRGKGEVGQVDEAIFWGADAIHDGPFE